jgi:hypothetical protein
MWINESILSMLIDLNKIKDLKFNFNSKCKSWIVL